MNAIHRNLFLIFLSFALISPTLGQNKYTLSGYVRDVQTGEDMIGATVVIPEVPAGAISNEYGFFSLRVPTGDYQVILKSLGYRTDTFQINLDKNVERNFQLEPEGVGMKEVVITDRASDDNVKSLEMSTEKVSLKTIKRLPAFMGEVDVIRSVQLLPGVQGVGEGITGYYVRGGQANQNLILLDESTVYNASHLLGFFSVFNSDALRDEYTLYKGGIPAQYGTRLSSVLDLKMKEGNNKEYHAQGGIGLISSRLTVEGPIAEDKASFILSGRRTYGDLFLRLSPNEALNTTRLYFYDFNAKANWRISEKDRLFLSGYFGKDVFKFRDLFSNDWGNKTGTLRWNHLFSSRLFSNTTLLFSDFDYGFDAKTFTGETFFYGSGIRDYGLREDMTWFATPKLQVKFGGDIVLHRFNPGVFEPEENTFLQELVTDPDYALEGSGYVQSEHQISDRFSMSYGLRYSFFNQIGPGDEYNFNEDYTEVLDTTSFGQGQLIQHYGGFEPRMGLRLGVDEFSSVKASYMRTRQYLHLLGNSTASFPWDIWVPSSRHIKPQIADQVAVGYFRNFLENRLETSVELYYKDMQNQVDFKNGAELFLNNTLETEILTGEGTSYGAEFLVRKTKGKLTGWVGYTLSRSRRRIDGINLGEWYNANQDRRHDVSVVGSWQVAPRWNVAGTWVFASGSPVTFPIGAYIIGDNLAPLYGDRNASRLPAYHRMDLSVTIDGKPREKSELKRRFENSWNFSIYNAYGRRNAFSFDFREEKTENVLPNGDIEIVCERKAYKLYLFRWVPSITWNFKF